MSESLVQRAGAKAVIEAEGGLLVLHPSPIDLNRNWQWPGGIRDDIEEPLIDTCLREVDEETGIDLTGIPHKLLRYGEWEAVDKGERVKILALFFHFILPERPWPILSHEHDDHDWINRANYLDFEANPEVHEVVEQVL